MKPETKIQLLRYALIAFGLFFIFGLYPAMHFWPSGWRWEPNQPHYEQMIIGVYATLGVFLLLASGDPFANRSLIWFTVWSSLVHATIMLFQAFQTKEYGHLYADIPALYLVAIILGGLMPRKNLSQ